MHAPRRLAALNPQPHSRQLTTNNQTQHDNITMSQKSLTAFDTAETPHDNKHTRTETQIMMENKDEIAAALLDKIERTPVVNEVLETFEFDQLVQDISAYGKRLRSNKPDADGLTQFVWRMGKYHATRTSSRPVMADCWLSSHLEEHPPLDEVDMHSSEFDEIKNALELVEMAALLKLGHDPTRRAKEMKGILY